jgi:hypothetical protein
VSELEEGFEQVSEVEEEFYSEETLGKTDNEDNEWEQNYWKHMEAHKLNNTNQRKQ